MAQARVIRPGGRNPPMEVSDEADEGMLQMARAQGAALERAARFMTEREADDGGEVHAGDYRVAYAVESAEGLYHAVDGELEWREPEDENCHVEIAVRDAADGRFVPGLEVRVTLVDSEGKPVGSHPHPFLWHPWLYHYGRNWTVPGPGTYTLRVRVEAPDFPRHDRENGRRYAEPVEVEFQGVRIETGRKT